MRFWVVISEAMLSTSFELPKREVVSPEGVLPPLARTVQVVSKWSGVWGKEGKVGELGDGDNVLGTRTAET